MEILDNFIMPVMAGHKGRSGSKYMTAEQLEVLSKLKVGQAVIFPFLDLPDTKNPQTVQCNNSVWYANRWAKEAANGMVFISAIVEGKGVAIKLKEIKVPVVVAPVAPVVPAMAVEVVAEEVK